MNDTEIVTSRQFAAAPPQVFRAFSDPAILARWWGPQGFTNTFKVFDMAPGGLWRFVMHGPDGVNYPNECEFVAVEAPARIVFRHLSGPQFEATLLFKEQDGGTWLDWTMRFDSAAECARISKFAVEANEQNLDRLQHQLDKMA